MKRIVRAFHYTRRQPSPYTDMFNQLHPSEIPHAGNRLVYRPNAKPLEMTVEELHKRFRNVDQEYIVATIAK